MLWTTMSMLRRVKKLRRLQMPRLSQSASSRWLEGECFSKMFMRKSIDKTYVKKLHPSKFRLTQVRPHIPQLTCLVQMNNQSIDKSYIDVPIDSFNATSSYGVSTEPTIKQEVMQVIPGSSRRFLATSMNSSMNSQIDLSRSNENIEYISNDLDDDNIQGSNHFSVQFSSEIIFILLIFS